MKRKFFRVIVPILVLMEFCSVFLMFKSFDNKNDNLSEIQEENVVEKKRFAMYVENDNGEYEEYTESNYFPEGYELNLDKSMCVDNNGNKLENVLSANSNNISVTSNKTSYCYLYFDNLIPISEYLLENPSTGLNTTMEGGLYRYQGTNDTVNNYLCFGYSNYETDCDFTNTTNSDLYAYRIIGINESGQLKLIKYEALNTAYVWNSSTGVTWAESELYKNLNGSYFYSNTTYVPTSWQIKIALTTWKYGDTTTSNANATTIYTTESEWSNTTSAKIGLMYLHDYVFSYQNGGLNCSLSGDYSTCKTAWIHLSNNDTKAPNTYEWLISRYDTTYAWVVLNTGRLSNNDMSYYSYSIRPVFYLTSDVQFVDGTGTSSDPFIIK